MKIRKTTEYEIECKGCGSMLRISYDELKFHGIDDQRLPCPACGRNNLVIQGGRIADGMIPKLRDKEWRQV